MIKSAFDVVVLVAMILIATTEGFYVCHGIGPRIRMIPATIADRSSTCAHGMLGNDGNDSGRSRLTKPLIMATSVVLVVGRRSLTAGLGSAILVLAYWAWKKRGPTDSDDIGQNETLSNIKVSNWVSNRLNDIQLQEDEKDERLRENERARQAKVMENARKWAASTLETTEELQQRAQERRVREAEETRRAKLWVENVARGSGIDLGGDDENDSEFFGE